MRGIGRPPRHVDYAESLWARYEDLGLENSEIAELKKSGKGMALEPYPLAVREGAFPPVMEWL